MDSPGMRLRRTVWLAIATAVLLAWSIGSAAAAPPPVSALTSGGPPSYLTEHDGVGVFLAGCDGNWQSDGTAAGTHPSAYRSIGWGTFGAGMVFGPDGMGFPSTVWTTGELFPLGGSYYYQGMGNQTTGNNSGVLWKTDGSGAGTGPVGRFPSSPGLGITTPVFAAGGKLYVKVLDESTHYAVLWAGDGTAAGSQALAGLSGKYPVPQLFQYHGAVFFTSNGLWTTDGTTDGTHLVTRDLYGPFVGFGDRMYAFGPDGRLWTSDGTAEGTAAVPSGPVVPGAGDLTVAGGALYFTSSDPGGTTGVWRSDGTGAGTVEIGSIPTGTSVDGVTGPAHQLTVLHGDVYLSVDDGTHGAELWVVPATGGSAHLVDDLAPGAVGSNPRNLMAIGDHLLFIAAPSGDADDANLYGLPAQDGRVAALTPWATCREQLLQAATAPTPTPTPGVVPTPTPAPPAQQSSPQRTVTVAQLRALIPSTLRARKSTVTLGKVTCPSFCGRVTLKLAGAAKATAHRTLQPGASWTFGARLTAAARRTLARHRTAHLLVTLTVVPTSGETLRATRMVAVAPA